MALRSFQALTPGEAERALAGRRLVDPLDLEDVRGVLRGGAAVRATFSDGDLVLVLEQRGATLWVTAAAGDGRGDLTAAGLELVEAIAAQRGCAGVAFQTARAGLVDKAERHGYRAAGWIMRKSLQ